MQIQENTSLKAFNTFGISAIARYFASFANVEELSALVSRQSNPFSYDAPFLVLGGGSNILLTSNFDGLVVKNNIAGVEVVKEDDEFVYVKAGAGENWHQFVLYCIDHNFGGVENLSLIPGNTGATPMQNIGAYGVEIKDVFAELEAYHIHDKKTVLFNLSDCAFGYRESVFKRTYKGQFVILTVTYKLRKKPVFNTSYGAINAALEEQGVQELSLKAISDAVICIRSSKLPDPAVTGNAGSFFKNPQVTALEYQALKTSFPGIIAYPVGEGAMKLAAGWMIEQCGWKGYREGDAGVHPHQALVLVNYGNASGKNIYDLSTQIIKSVQQKFNVLLEREVNII